LKYSLQFAPQTKKDLKKLPKEIQKFIFDSLEIFVKNFSDTYENELIKKGKIKKLKGEWSGFYRLRLRSYRVIYRKETDKFVILVVRVRHRKEIY
jgi:mRNA interferase RelE/StbE